MEMVFFYHFPNYIRKIVCHVLNFLCNISVVMLCRTNFHSVNFDRKFINISNLVSSKYKIEICTKCSLTHSKESCMANFFIKNLVTSIQSKYPSPDSQIILVHTKQVILSLHRFNIRTMCNYSLLYNSHCL